MLKGGHFIIIRIIYKKKDDMEESIKDFLKTLKIKYPNAVCTREFYRKQNILIRVTEIHNITINSKNKIKERKLDDWYIRQRGER